MKRWLSLALALVLMLSILAACGKSNTTTTDNTDKQSTDTTAQTETKDDSSTTTADTPKIAGKILFATNRTDLVDTKLKEYADQFHAKYPDATVEFEAIGGDYDKTIKIRMASGELPDVSFIPSIPNTDYPKYYAPLDDLGLDDNIYFKDIHSFDGKLYGIATGADTTGIEYNKKAFAAAGITDVPKTWSEFLADCEKLKAKGIVPLASNFKDKWPLGAWAYDVPRMIANDANVLNARIDTDTPYAPDSASVKSWDLLRTLYQKGYLEPDVNSTNWEQSKKDIASGKFAMYLLGNWVINQIIDNGAKPEDIGFFPFPTDDSGKLVAVLGPDWCYAVSKDSKNLDTAKAFVKFMLEDTDYADFAGFIPTLKDHDPKLSQLAEFKGLNPTFIESIADDPKSTDIQNKAQIDPPAIVQEYVLAKDPQTVLDKYNKAWAEARKQVGQ